MHADVHVFLSRNSINKYFITLHFYKVIAIFTCTYAVSATEGIKPPEPSDYTLGQREKASNPEPFDRVHKFLQRSFSSAVNITCQQLFAQRLCYISKT